jgi:hypothetical protein
MPTFFPCPNPACSYQFDAEQLPAAAMVTCPICRTRFPYRAAAPAAVPAAESDADENWNRPADSERARPRTNRLVNPRNLPKKSKAQLIVTIIGSCAVVVTATFVLISASKLNWFGKDEQNPRFVDENFNFSFMKFDKAKWREDPDLRNKLGMNSFLYRRQDGGDTEAWFGLRCLPLGGEGGVRGPREGELESELKKTFNKFTGIQRDPIQASVGKQAVDGFKFVGELDGASIMGEAYIFHNKGIAYQMLLWTTTGKWGELKGELYGQRDTFLYANQRDKWVDRVAEKAYYVPNGDYEVVDPSGLWQIAIPEMTKRGDFVSDPKLADENATMLFRCVDPDREKGARRSGDYPANAMVLVLPKAGDSLDDAKKYVRDMLIKTSVKADYTFEPYAKLPFEFKAPATTASVGSFKVSNSVDPKDTYFYGISVKKIGGQAVVFVGWCKDKAYAEAYGPLILRFAASLKERHQ